GNAQMGQLASYAQSAGLKRIYVLDSNFLYIHLMAKYFKKAAPMFGIKIVGSSTIPFGATGFPSDFSAFVDKIKAAKPQAGMTVNGALGAITYPGHGEHNPTNNVAVIKIQNRKFTLVKLGVPTRVPGI